MIRIPTKASLIEPLVDETYAEVDSDGRVTYVQIYDEPQISLTLFCLSNIKDLDIRRSSFEGSSDVFPYAILRLSNSLTCLHIESIPITSFPKHFGRLKYLEDLTMINISVSYLPESFRELSSIKRMTIEGTNIVSLPDWFNSFRVETLELRFNRQLFSIDSINGNPWITSIKVNGCLLERIPIFLPNLYFLDASNNLIKNIDKIETLGDKTTKTKTFIFTQNFIRNIPEEISQIVNLKMILFNQNPMKSLPMSLLRIQNQLVLDLTETCVHHKKIETLQNLIVQSNLKINVSFSRGNFC